MFVFRFEFQIFLRHLFHHQANAKSLFLQKRKYLTVCPGCPCEGQFSCPCEGHSSCPSLGQVSCPSYGTAPSEWWRGTGRPSWPPLYPTQAVVSPSLSLPHCRKKASNCSKTKYLRTFLFKKKNWF